MTRYLLLLFLLLPCLVAYAQHTQTYTSADGEVHLTGPTKLDDLRIAPYAEWYEQNAAATQLPDQLPLWAENLSDTDVTIYLGTWCGDSKKWVPRFITLWETLGLDLTHLHFVSLYDTDDLYKQGPAGEEKGRRIHRVPTFLFERGGVEYARIVEQPRTDLITDVAQIALGYPTAPRYPGANYFFDLFENIPADTVAINLGKYYQEIYRDLGSPGELNTLGNVLRAAGNDVAAFAVFRINASLYQGDVRSLRQYGEAARAVKEYSAALQAYTRLKELEPQNEAWEKALVEVQALTSAQKE